MENLYRVSASSKPVSVAGAIAGSIRDGDAVALQAIGAGSVNQAVKAICIARNFVGVDGLDVIACLSWLYSTSMATNGLHCGFTSISRASHSRRQSQSRSARRGRRSGPRTDGSHNGRSQ